MAIEGFTYDTLETFIGQALGTSRWVTIDQAQINAFADATHDHQWIHVDEEKAKNSPLGTTIAHGYLTLSLVSDLIGDIGIVPENTMYALNYGTDKVRFTSFVKVNSRVRCHAKLVGVSPKRGGHLIKTEITMEVEGEEKPAMIAEVLTLAYPG